MKRLGFCARIGAMLAVPFAPIATRIAPSVEAVVADEAEFGWAFVDFRGTVGQVVAGNVSRSAILLGRQSERTVSIATFQRAASGAWIPQAAIPIWAQR